MEIFKTTAANVTHLFFRWLSGRSRLRIFLFCLALTCLVGFVDFLAGKEVSLSIVYAVPISVATWFLGRTAGLGLAILSILLWISGDFATGVYQIGPVVPLINIIFRCTFYVCLILVLLRLAQLQREFEHRAQDRALALARETAERARLEQELLEISEREHARFGRDLHDGLCQHLTGTALAGHVLAEALAKSNAPEAAGVRNVVSLVQEAIVLARGMAKGLHPVEPQPEGLMQALEEFAAVTTNMFGIECQFECHGPVFIHNPTSATHLYRIAQEAVANAIKHGRAQEIVIVLEASEFGLRLAVRDNGKGFSDFQESNPGMGLRIMSDRAKMIGGELTVKQDGPSGVEVNCCVPHAGESGATYA